MNQIQKIYDILLNEFGHQGWWPVTPTCCIDNELRPSYGIKSKTDKQCFEIMLGAILTQNTSWKNVEKAIESLNKHSMVDIDKILKSNTSQLANLIKPSGYYNQKAERLKIITDFLKKNPLTKLKHIETPELRKQLLSLKGIGPETADSILLYALERPIFVIDAYTKRIFAALGYKANSYDEWQNLFMDNLPKDHTLFNEYHALLVELAKKNCKKVPICNGCSINEICKNKKV
ncbi:MAG: endonuclease [Nanoarchaeota archaeon]|nr:endonuclease [Nanoarchaeota archaeon]MBU1005844.1 endonuclease [Nanoarchaeota archaeon]MBU1946112.1 endonuclease [Nanoarchaeota archaeon]